jgi:hypothetical protein
VSGTSSAPGARHAEAHGGLSTLGPRARQVPLDRHPQRRPGGPARGARRARGGATRPGCGSPATFVRQIAAHTTGTPRARVGARAAVSACAPHLCRAPLRCADRGEADRRDHRAERLSTDAKLARMSGTAPIPASPGQTNRHRLNRGRVASSTVRFTASRSTKQIGGAGRRERPHRLLRWRQLLHPGRRAARSGRWRRCRRGGRTGHARVNPRLRGGEPHRLSHSPRFRDRHSPRPARARPAGSHAANRSDDG